VVELAGGGYDTQITSLTKAMAAANVEALIYNGSLAFTGYSRAEGSAITGGAANDTLIGGGGVDIFNGKAGSDVMTGGGGADVFRFENLGQGIDRITDFQIGVDHISLQASSFGVATLADLSFVSGSAPQAAAGEAALLYNTSTGALVYDANGGSSADGVQIAIIVNKATLSLGDFWVV